VLKKGDGEVKAKKNIQTNRKKKGRRYNSKGGKKKPARDFICGEVGGCGARS